jgi:hypothetical protein
VAFRFAFIYLALWCIANQVLAAMLLTPFGSLPNFGQAWPMRAITQWTALHVFGVEAVLERGNSGDTLFHWVQTFWLFVVSLAATAAWSQLDRQRTNYERLHQWFRLFIRFALAAQMFYFGMAKVIPTQFVPPALTTLVQPVGNMALSNLLWVFIGASTPYQIFTGVAELLAAVLLVLPKTTPLGALICIADMVQVFALNASYDFGLKQISFHYILMSLFLLAPDARRLLNVLLLDRAAPAASHPPLFKSAQANRRLLIAQVVFGIYLAGMFTSLQVRQWDQPDGPAHPRSALYGIWDVEQMSVDGTARPTVMNDYVRRWRRLVFDFPDRMAFQRTDDSMARYDTSIDVDRKTLILRMGATGSWLAAFRFERPAEDRLVLDGTMDGHDIHLQLSLVGRDTWPLLNSPFRWVRPPD